ncbi:MAG: protein kinase [Alphaproteobacteria bacterium]|nr:protein kinase [Alphaproteobacteria bacterium]
MSDAELTPTGRELRDPAATLVECVDPRGLKHTVIRFDEAHRGHVTLTTAVDLIESFMGYPMVTGLVECTSIDTKNAQFAYPTGTIWTLKEVMRGFDQVGKAVGCRAALEICYLGGMILHEAGDTGPLQGCFSHGNLNPWRIGVKGDGQLQIFGYGLAQVEMYEFVHGAAEHIDNDSIRYAPPERLEGQPEQPSSDTYSLAVLAHELITGRPLFDHKEARAMWESVKMAEGVQRMLDAKDVPKKVREVLSSALIYDPDTRLSGEPFVEAIGKLLDDASIDGRTLSDVMRRMNQTTRQSSRKLVNVKATATAAFDPAALAALAEEAAAEDDEDEDDEEEAGSAPGQPRWGAVSRERTTGRARQLPGEENRLRRRPGFDEDDDSNTTRRRRRRRDEAEESTRQRRRNVPVAEPEDEDDEATDIHVPEDDLVAPRRRRRRRTEDEPAEAQAAPEEAPSDEGDGDADDVEFPRRRRRRRGGDDGDDTDARPAEAPKAEPTKAEQPKSEPKAEPARSEPKAEPAKSESPKVEPTKVEPAKAEPAKVEPAKAEPAKAEPDAKPEPAAGTGKAPEAGSTAAASEAPKAEPTKAAPPTEAPKADAGARPAEPAPQPEGDDDADGDLPRRRRRRRSEAEEDAPPAAAASADEGGDDDPALPRRRRRRREGDDDADAGAAGAPDTAEPADEGSDDGDVPRRRRRRRSEE